jgi:DNA-directed RNA polymerase subunit L
MELNLVEKKKGRLVFELPGADHTFCNALKTELWSDEDVKIATYAIKHPLLAVPRFIVETKRGDAKDALQSAVGRLQKQFKSFGTAFNKI